MATISEATRPFRCIAGMFARRRVFQAVSNSVAAQIIYLQTSAPTFVDDSDLQTPGTAGFVMSQ